MMDVATNDGREMNVAQGQRSPRAIVMFGIAMDISADEAWQKGRLGSGKLVIGAWEEH